MRLDGTGPILTKPHRDHTGSAFSGGYSGTNRMVEPKPHGSEPLAFPGGEAPLTHTGLRIGEAIALRWSDVDFNRRRVSVERRYYRGTFDRPKSKYGRRKVPLSEGMARELEAQWLLAENVEGLLFPSEVGGVIDGSNLMRRVLKPAGRRAGVPWVGFHTFRHTCATMLLRAGWNAKQVQITLGHHSPAFTLAIYVHFLDDDLPDASFLDDVTGEGGNGLATSPTEIPLRPDEGQEADSMLFAAETLVPLRSVGR
jgi:hypothetical protein